jgi:hypothetical protein
VTAWELDDYADLLGAAKQGGYRCAHFGQGPEPGQIFLRHDVDLSLEAAIRMAELEHGLGITATYFLMTESVFYNLASSEGRLTIDRLRSLGHSVGLHAIHPRAVLDDRFDAVVAWHNPDPDTMSAVIPGAINVMEPRYFSATTYRSDSNQHWRSGDPREELRAGRFPWLQLLVHPEIWAFPGDRMGETMRSMISAEADRRLVQLADDRIDLT